MYARGPVVQVTLTRTGDSWFCRPGFWSARIWRKTCGNISVCADRCSSLRTGNTVADCDYYWQRSHHLPPPQRPASRWSVDCRTAKSFPAETIIIKYNTYTNLSRLIRLFAVVRLLNRNDAPCRTYAAILSSPTSDRSHIIGFGRRGLCCSLQNCKSAKLPRRAASTFDSIRPLALCTEWPSGVRAGFARWSWKRNRHRRQYFFFHPVPKSRLSSKFRLRRVLISDYHYQQKIIHYKQQFINRRPKSH